MITRPNDTVTPTEVEIDIPGGYSQKGMTSGLTKREYFAAKALQGLLSIYDDSTNRIVPNHDNTIYMAQLSVKAADALIKVLNETND